MRDRPTILLIDDDPDFLEATCAVLESASYQVLVAYNGDEGLAKAQEGRPDLIILDVIMPGEDGFQTLERLRAEPALMHVPVMMLTSLVNVRSTALRDLGLSMTPAGGADATVEDYIEKPIKPAELLRQVEKYLERRNTPLRDEK